MGERDRIVRAGGLVMTQRINGSLAVSRALGDFDYKSVMVPFHLPNLFRTDQNRLPTEQLVSPEPDVTCLNRDPDDQYIWYFSRLHSCRDNAHFKALHVMVF